MSKAALVLATMLGTGCATLFGSSTSTVTVTTREAGTPITIDGAPAGSAPGVVTVTSHQTHVIASPTSSCPVTSSVNPVWVVLDVLGGGIPLIVDAVTGAWKNTDTGVCVL